MVGDVMVGGGLNNEYSSKKTQNIINIEKVYENQTFKKSVRNL